MHKTRCSLILLRASQEQKMGATNAQVYPSHPPVVAVAHLELYLAFNQSDFKVEGRDLEIYGVIKQQN